MPSCYPDPKVATQGSCPLVCSSSLANALISQACHPPMGISAKAASKASAVRSTLSSGHPTISPRVLSRALSESGVSLFNDILNIFLNNREVNIHAPSCLGNEVNGIAIHYTTTCQVHCIICYHRTHCSEVADPLQRCANFGDLPDKNHATESKMYRGVN